MSDIVERLRQKCSGKANAVGDQWGDWICGEAANEIATLRQKLEEAERERKNLQAQLTARAKSMLRLRDALTEVHDNIEDEGDRAYFGSTNDADQLREVWQDLEAWKWDDIMADGKLPDVYKSSREAHARAEAAEARAIALEAENAALVHDNARYVDAAAKLATENERLREAIEYAHAHGFDWPSDPFARAALTGDPAKPEGESHG